MPDGVDLHWVDDRSGRLSARDCAGARLLPFVAGTQPRDRSECADQPSGIRGWFERLFGDW